MGLMYYLVFCLIAIVLLGIFLPDGIGGEIHNPYLLIFLSSIAVIILSVKFIRYLRFCLSAKKELINKGYSIVYFNILPIGLRKKQNIIAVKNEKVVNISFIYVTKKYLRYHFESINKIELYKSTRLTVKPSVRQANIISPKVETRKVSTKYLNWVFDTKDKETENQIKIIVFNTMPNTVTGTYSREYLSNGDKVDNSTYIYDLKHFSALSSL